jgi:alginate O-acetyltransferase complex protein AlgI
LDFALRVTLPLGISFYTFQTMSYTLDVYRGHAKAICHFPDFACFVSMFPQLVAGPIIRFSDIADQIRRRDLSTEKFARGVAFFGMGLAKKILLANPCGKIADTVFNAASADVAHSWYGVTAYAFQIYFDFSGYSDMAIGLGLMLGFVFAKNFDSPYRSRSMTEFWKRWHISLSTWLRDYLYIPLGGNRRGPIRTYVNLGLVMLLGGLWHGAAWTFVIWGALHGTILCLERLRGKTSVYERLPGALQTGITFVVVLFTWVFFRSPDLPAALEYCGRMLGLGAAEPGTGLIAAVIFRPYYVLTFAVAAVVVWLGPQTWDWTRKLTLGKAVAILCLVWASVLALTTQTYNPFIYFIF